MNLEKFLGLVSEFVEHMAGQFVYRMACFFKKTASLYNVQTKL